MYGKVNSLGLSGIHPYLVKVEVDVQKGLPIFDVVGLPDVAVKEAKERVRAAVQNLGYSRIESRIVANLAPAGTRKQGAMYDLPILLALLIAAGCEDFDLEGTAVLGEISLQGELRGVSGVLPMVLDASKLGLKRVIVPAVNAAEAANATDVEVLSAVNAEEIILWAYGRKALPPASSVSVVSPPRPYLPDLAEVKGQEEAKRALEIAAAGGHNLLLIGPPGTGKSMLAKRLPSILPPLTREEAIETTKIHSVAECLEPGVGLLSERPFRSPHHSISPFALTGGGIIPKPGEISLAHNGVLFLDELPEFAKNALEVLRQPLEDGQVTIARVKERLTYPSKAMLVAAMNPCPCGFFGHPTKECTCSPQVISRYLGKVSGPMLDRIDIHVEVPPVNFDELASRQPGESSSAVRERVARARERQQQRYKGSSVTCNAALPSKLLAEACVLEPAAEAILKAAYDRLGLSARGYDRVLKVARTIADMDAADKIAAAHISQAIQFRSLDRKYWAL